MHTRIYIPKNKKKLQMFIFIYICLDYHFFVCMHACMMHIHALYVETEREQNH